MVSVSLCGLSSIPSHQRKSNISDGWKGMYYREMRSEKNWRGRERKLVTGCSLGGQPFKLLQTVSANKDEPLQQTLSRKVLSEKL